MSSTSCLCPGCLQPSAEGAELCVEHRVIIPLVMDAVLKDMAGKAVRARRYAARESCIKSRADGSSPASSPPHPSADELIELWRGLTGEQWEVLLAMHDPYAKCYSYERWAHRSELAHETDESPLQPEKDVQNDEPFRPDLDLLTKRGIDPLSENIGALLCLKDDLRERATTNSLINFFIETRAHLSEHREALARNGQPIFVREFDDLSNLLLVLGNLYARTNTTPTVDICEMYPAGLPEHKDHAERAVVRALLVEAARILDRPSPIVCCEVVASLLYEDEIASDEDGSKLDTMIEKVRKVEWRLRSEIPDLYGPQPAEI